MNGWEARIKRFGSKDAFYKYILAKGRETRIKLYGNEFYSNSEKAQQTMLKRYGVPFYTMTQDCIQKGHTAENIQKRIDTRRKNNTFNTSSEETLLYEYLCDLCGQDDVFKEYQDTRYMDARGYKFKCDFYIKSRDLFIELNLFPTHGTHPFNQYDKEDVKTVEILRNNPTR